MSNLSDFAVPVSALVRKSGSTMTGELILSGAPSSDLSAATKAYVDAAITGLNVKEACKVATTGSNIALSGLQTIDDVVLSAGDRVLVKDQTNGTENGIYDVAAGSWSRSEDADNSPGSEVAGGMYVFVLEGTANSGTGYTIGSPSGVINLGIDSITFVTFTNGTAPVTSVAGKTGVVTLDIADISGLQLTLDGKAAASHGHGISDVTNLQTSLDAKAAVSHTHAISNITDLQTTLDGKADTSHTHTISAITDLQTTLNGKVNIAGDTMTSNLRVSAAGVNSDLYTNYLKIGENATTELTYLELGSGRGGDGTCLIDFVSDTTYSDWSLRMIRSAGANGQTTIAHRGTGHMALSAEDDSTIALWVNGGQRAAITDDTFKITTPTLWLANDVDICMDTTVAPDGLGIKRITCNDGSGNFNIRSANYFNGTSNAYTTTGDGAIWQLMASDAQAGTITWYVADTGTADVAVTWSASMQLNINGLDMQGSDVFNYGERIQTVTGTAITPATANMFKKTVTANTTFTFSAPGGLGCTMIVWVYNGGNFTVTWPASVDWPAGAAPSLSVNKWDMLVFSTNDGGTTWYGVGNLNFS